MFSELSLFTSAFSCSQPPAEMLPFISTLALMNSFLTYYCLTCSRIFYCSASRILPSLDWGFHLVDRESLPRRRMATVHAKFSGHIHCSGEKDPSFYQIFKEVHGRKNDKMYGPSRKQSRWNSEQPLKKKVWIINLKRKNNNSKINFRSLYAYGYLYFRGPWYSFYKVEYQKVKRNIQISLRKIRLWAKDAMKFKVIPAL